MNRGVHVAVAAALAFGSCLCRAQSAGTSDAQGGSPSQTPAAQTSPAAAAPAATPAPVPATTFSPSAVRYKGIDFNLMADGYYSFDDNHSASGFNQLYGFDDKTDRAELNLLRLTASYDPAPIGFRFDVGYGRTMVNLHIPVPNPAFFRYVEQAYISVKPKNWKGFEADFGDFLTSAGSEVVESKDNWNYSRSLLFILAEPFYHFGIRTSMPVNNSLSVGLQLVNGWNTIVDDHGNNMQTLGITGTVTRKKFTWANTYYVGPQWTPTNTGTRNFIDSALLLTPLDKLNAYINFDYGRQPHVGASADHWIGIAGAVHYQLSKRIAVTPRLEYFNDPTGFASGAIQKLHEVTLTGEYKIWDGLLSRLEFRRDGSNIPFFDRGGTPSTSKSQTTVTFAMIAFFPVKH